MFERVRLFGFYTLLVLTSSIDIFAMGIYVVSGSISDETV
jgi:hypothetical protein